MICMLRIFDGKDKPINLLTTCKITTKPSLCLPLWENELIEDPELQNQKEKQNSLASKVRAHKVSSQWSWLCDPVDCCSPQGSSAYGIL